MYENLVQYIIKTSQYILLLRKNVKGKNEKIMVLKISFQHYLL